MVPSQLWPKISTGVFKVWKQNSYLSTFPLLFSQNFKTESISPETIEKSQKIGKKKSFFLAKIDHFQLQQIQLISMRNLKILSKNFPVRVCDPCHTVSTDRWETTLVQGLPVVLNSISGIERANWQQFSKVSIKSGFDQFSRFCTVFKILTTKRS